MKKAIALAALVALSGCSSLISTVDSTIGSLETAGANNAKVINAAAVSDLTAAIADAQAHGDTAAVQCYQALLDVANKAAALTTDIKPGPIALAQRTRDGVRLAEGQGPLAVSCAALKESAKADVLDLASLLGMTFP
jgi:hypothetical protein